MAKQVCDIKSTKGIAAADSREQTRSWTEKQVELRKENKNLNYDFSRSHLNFEIVDGVIKDVDKHELLDDSIRSNLKRRGIPHPDESESHVRKGQQQPKKMERIVAARMILGGSTERMNEIAFGDQFVDYRQGADNSHIKRTAAFEEWAMDEYNYLENFYGKGSVARFIVHLDESWPHIHATVIPTALIKGKERVSWRTVFGGSLDVSRAKWKNVLDEHYEQVGRKWGLERGDPKDITGAKHKSNREYNKELEEQNRHLEIDNSYLEDSINELSERYKSIEKELGKSAKAMKSLTTMITKRLSERQDALSGLQTVQQQLDLGELSPDQYESIVRETIDKIKCLEDFVQGKMDKLAEVSVKLEEAQTFKEKYSNSNWWKKMSEARSIDRATDEIRLIAERLGLDAKDADLKQLGTIFHDYAAQNAIMQRKREEELNKLLNLEREKGWSEGTNATMKIISVASGRNWAIDKMPSPEKLGEWYKYYYKMYNEVRRYEREHGETIWNKLSAAERIKDEVSSLKRLLPTFDMAVRIIKNKFDYAGHDLSFSMEETEPIWRMLATATTKDQCKDMANNLISMAQADYQGNPIEAWVSDVAECVMAIVDNINPLSAIFGLLPDCGAVGGGGADNNELPRKKDDDEYRRCVFFSIMGRNNGRKRC